LEQREHDDWQKVARKLLPLPPLLDILIVA